MDTHFAIFDLMIFVTKHKPAKPTNRTHFLRMYMSNTNTNSLKQKSQVGCQQFCPQFLFSRKSLRKDKIAIWVVTPYRSNFQLKYNDYIAQFFLKDVKIADQSSSTQIPSFEAKSPKTSGYLEVPTQEVVDFLKTKFSKSPKTRGYLNLDETRLIYFQNSYQ